MEKTKQPGDFFISSIVSFFVCWIFSLYCLRKARPAGAPVSWLP